MKEDCFGVIRGVFINMVDTLITLLDVLVYEDLMAIKSRSSRVFHGLYGVTIRNSHLLVYFIMILNSLYYANLLSLIYPISLFSFCIMESPRPSKKYWRFLFLYTTFVICLKFLFQFTVFCTCYSTQTGIWYNIQPFCDDTSYCTPYTEYETQNINWPTLIGVTKLSQTDTGVFVWEVFMDVLMLLVLNLNQLCLKLAGLWDFVGSREENDEKPVETITPLNEKRQKALHRLSALRKPQGPETNSPHLDLSPDSTKDTPPDPPSTRMDGKTKPPLQSNPSGIGWGGDLAWLPEKNLKTELGDVEMSKIVDIIEVGGMDERKEGEEVGENLKLEEDNLDSTAGSSLSIQSVLIPMSSGEELENKEEDSKSESDSLSLEDELAKKTLSTRGEKIKKITTEYIGNFTRAVEKYYSDMFNENKNGSDYYAGIFFVDLISFFILAFWPKQFIGESSNIVQFLNGNSLLPTVFVVSLLIQFGLIVIEYIIYLYRAIRLKLVLLYLLILVYHYLLFVFIPIRQNLPFATLGVIIFFYLLKVAYFVMSGLQIRYGYTKLNTGRLFQSDEQPGYIAMIYFVCYRAIPFLYELRTLLEWAITPTTLNLYEWLKFEDIYAEIFLVKCRICLERSYERKTGDIQPNYYKILTGGGLFLLFVLVLWSPLIIFTQGTSFGIPNPITQASIRIGIVGYQNLYTASELETISEINPTQFETIVKYFESGVAPFVAGDLPGSRVITFSPYSGTMWEISAPMRAKLIQSLGSNDTMSNLNFMVSVAFERDKPDDSKVITWTTGPLAMLASQKRAMYMALNGTLDPRNNFVVFEKILPRAFLLPITGLVKSSTECLDLVLSLNYSYENFTVITESNTTQFFQKFSEYWKMEDDTENSLSSKNIMLFVISTPFVNWIPESLVVAGIIGVYSVFVLGLGRFLRIYVSGLSHRAIYEDMPEVEEILEYCTDILLARQDGAPELEEELFRELIELYRSPEQMILKTIPKAPQFKQPKEKED